MPIISLKVNSNYYSPHGRRRKKYNSHLKQNFVLFYSNVRDDNDTDCDGDDDDDNNDDDGGDDGDDDGDDDNSDDNYDDDNPCSTSCLLTDLRTLATFPWSNRFSNPTYEKIFDQKF